MGSDTFFAALGLLVCLGLAVHMALGRSRQLRVNAWFARMSWALRAWWQRKPWRRGDRRLAKDVAEDAIRRARSSSRTDGQGHGEWEGNVYFPKRFEERRRKRKLH